MKSLFFKKLILIIMVLLGLLSLIALMRKEDTGLMLNGLEGLLMVYCGGAFLWAKSERIDSVIVIRWLIAIYTLLSGLYAVWYINANLLDFLMIYKSFFYLFLLSFLVGKKLMEGKHVLLFFNIFLCIFLVKYLLSIVLEVTDRPVVYEENNFELMLLYALYLLRYSVTKEKHLQYLALIGIITLLSLSRSSLVMFSVLVVFVVYSSYKKTWVFIVPFATIVLSSVIFYVFSKRSGSIEEIDRYRFMLVFLDEVKDWNFLQWIVGGERITRLSYAGCDAMKDYRNLFSFSGDGTCYSVILHSFLLRVILDHGLLGLIFIVYSTYLFLVKSGVSTSHTLVFLGIVILNGLSVSSFNNLFFAISMVFLMTTNRFRSDLGVRKVIRLPWALPMNNS